MKLGLSASVVLHAHLWQQRGGSFGGFASANQHGAKPGVGLRGRGSEGGRLVDGIAGEVGLFNYVRITAFL